MQICVCVCVVCFPLLLFFKYDCFLLFVYKLCSDILHNQKNFDLRLTPDLMYSNLVTSLIFEIQCSKNTR